MLANKLSESSGNSIRDGRGDHLTTYPSRLIICLDILMQCFLLSGMLSAFNRFFGTTLHRMIFHHRSLLAIKAAVENLDLFGDRLTHLDVVTASELIRSRIPSQWMSLAGETAPPNSTPLSQWLSDLSTRVAHFERILVLVSCLQFFRCFKFCKKDCGVAYVYRALEERLAHVTSCSVLKRICT